MSTVVKDLGAVSAYAYAVEKGYTGTEAEFAELMADYAEVGQRAEDAADSALESKTAAQTAATTATNKATEATTAATTATTKAGEASTSASTATSAKDTAVSASQTATTKATEATTAAATATSAKTDAVAANTAAQSAKTAAQTAQTGAETAAASVQSSAAQIATNAEDISQLKSDIDSIVIRSNNRLNLATITKDTYIDVGGTSTASANFSVTDYIPVTAGETIYFWEKRTDNLYYTFDARFLCAYDSSKSAVSASGGTWVAGEYTVPNGIAYVRLSISNTYLSTYSNFYVGILPLDDYEQYLPYGAVISLINQPQVDQNTTDIATNTTDIANITEMSSNLYNPSAITEGKYVDTDGTVYDLTTVSATDYMPVSEGQKIYGWGLTNGSYEAFSFIRVCAYDSSKNAVSASGWGSETSPPYTVPSGISYIRVTARKTALAYDNVYMGTNEVGKDYIAYGKIVKLPNSHPESYTVRSDGSILEGVMYCYEHDIKNLIVEAGTYDVISEYTSHYGATYFDEYVDYSQDRFDAGIWLQNINVKFSSGARVVCHYTGNNANVSQYFSAFATGNNVTIDGLVLDCENLRYAIHADYNSGSDETFFVVKNCDLKHYKNPTSMQAIGAGLGRHVIWTIENTIFRSSGGNHIVCRIHNNVNSDALSKVIVKDCYVDGDGYFKFEPYSTSTDITIVQVCGCSYKTAPVVEKITQESEDNMVMIAWNNELRS